MSKDRVLIFDTTLRDGEQCPGASMTLEEKLQVAEPWFEGGATPKHLTGQTFAKAEFSFTADEAGEYALACGFPAHAVAGHWVALNVSETAETPTLQLGDGKPVEVQ